MGPGSALVRRRIELLAALTLAAASFWGNSPAPPVVVMGRSPAAQPFGIEPASLRSDTALGLLCDYYEHGLEHAPPRGPDGVMQRREHSYQTPHDPMEFLQGRLTDAPDDRKLSRALTAFEGEWLAGGAITAVDYHFEDLAQRCSLDAVTLLEAGRGFAFLSGDELAAALFRAGMAKARVAYEGVAPGDPKARPLLLELDQTKALWRLGDYPALERRFRLARRLNPLLSVESRRAGCLLADSLFYQDRFVEAAEVILHVQSENARVGDLGTLDRSDRYEMEYLQGYLLSSAGRFEEAIEHLRRVIGGGEHDADAGRCLFEALLSVNRFDEAESLCGRIVERSNLSPEVRGAMSHRLELARQASRWRQQASALSE
jgi:tetratricopeptide (TPR) repeat protein